MAAVPVHGKVACGGVEPCPFIFRGENGVAAAREFYEKFLHKIFGFTDAPGGGPEITKQPVRVSGVEASDFLRSELRHWSLLCHTDAGNSGDYLIKVRNGSAGGWTHRGNAAAGTPCLRNRGTI